jgi:hypothetical protein
MCANGRPNAKDILENMKSPMPLGRKIRLILKNSATKLRKLQSCCGNKGEPGC